MKKYWILLGILLIFLFFILIFISRYFEHKKIDNLPLSIKNFYSLYDFYKQYDFKTVDGKPALLKEKDFKEKLSNKFSNIFDEPILTRFNNILKTETINSSYYVIFFNDLKVDSICKVIKKDSKQYSVIIKRSIGTSLDFAESEGALDAKSIIADYKIKNMTQKEFNKLVKNNSFIKINILEKDTFYLKPNKQGELLISDIKVEYLHSKIKL